VRRLGATAEESVDVRLLSATHQDLARRVAEGRFRQDLFYRLNVIELRSPSLRERPEDVPAIASAILDRMSARAGERRLRLSDEALLRLQRHPFPGNVRELENVLERAAALAADDELSAADLLLAPVAGGQRATADAGDHGGGPAGSDSGDDVEVGLAEATADATPPAPFTMDEGIPSDLSAYLDELERQAILAALLRTGHNRTAASTLLGITFRQLRYRMQRLGLR
jgi:two-component system response regulator PilR (NtrC family)